MYINLLCMFDNKGRDTLGDMLQGHVTRTSRLVRTALVHDAGTVSKLVHTKQIGAYNKNYRNH